MKRILISENKKNIRLLFLALIIGLTVGLTGSVFRLTLESVEKFRENLFENAGTSGVASWIWPGMFAVVCISLALFIIRKFAPEAAGSGIHEIEGALDGKRPMRWKQIIPVKFFASILSLGSGLLLGREGPTIQIGANIGQMVKDVLGHSDTEDNPLISTGAAAGLGSAFNAPFAGIIFVIEEMHEHFKFNFFSVAAIMLGAGTSDFVVRALVDTKPVIQMTIFPTPGIYNHWLFILLGIILSLIGLAFNKLLIRSIDFFGFLSRKKVIYTGLFAGIIITIVGFISPEMISGGYNTITRVLEHSFTLSFVLILFGVRLFLTIFSYSTGVAGGIFVPMLTLGVMTGMLFGILAQQLFPELVTYPGIFAVAGMAGIFASTVRAPLTGIVLAVEMTSNFELILPLIITAATSSVITTLLGNEPIYSTLLERILKK